MIKLKRLISESRASSFSMGLDITTVPAELERLSKSQTPINDERFIQRLEEELDDLGDEFMHSTRNPTPESELPSDVKNLIKIVFDESESLKDRETWLKWRGDESLNQKYMLKVKTNGLVKLKTLVELYLKTNSSKIGETIYEYSNSLGKPFSLYKKYHLRKIK